MVERASAGESTVYWARVDGGGAETSVPRGWLGGFPGLRAYVAAGAAVDAECSFLWTAGADQLLRVELVSRTVPAGPVSVEVTAAHVEAPFDLTPRELDVLTLVAGGLTNPEIAARLGTGRHTVATHIEHILAKLQAPTRAAAAATAIGGDLLTLPLRGGSAGLPNTPIQRLEQAVADRRREPPRRPARRTRPPRKAPIVIGGVYPSHGPSAADGLARRKATDLAIAEINTEGGIDGRPVRHLVTETDIADRDALARDVSGLVDQCPDAITLGYTLAARDDFATVFAAPAEHGCPVLHTATSASARQLVLDEPTRFGNIFQACAPEAHYGHGFVRTLDDLYAQGRWIPANRRLLVVDSDDPNLMTFTSGAADLAERSGWHLALERMDFLHPEWSCTLAQIGKIEPAAIMVSTWLPEVLIEFLRRVREACAHSQVYAIYAPSVPGFLERAGAAAEGLLWATVIGLYEDERAGRFARDFSAAHRADLGRSGAGIHYDMVHLLADAWRQADHPRDFGLVTRRMRHLVHRGVNGAYYFGTPGQSALTYPDDTRDPSIAQAHLVHQIQRGRHVIVAPGPYASGTFRPPTALLSARGTRAE